MNQKSKIIFISEFNDTKQKDKELMYYAEQLSSLELKLSMITAELMLTRQIINMIKNEKILDFSKSPTSDSPLI
jgi:hypothetical protein